MKRQLALLLVLILATSVMAIAADHTKGRAVQPLTSELKPGDYVWHPEISPAGPVVVIVSLPEQRMYVYRNGVRIGVLFAAIGPKTSVRSRREGLRGWAKRRTGLGITFCHNAAFPDRQQTGGASNFLCEVDERVW